VIIACASQPEVRMDPESLERENDHDIDALAEKTSFLRQVRRLLQGRSKKLLHIHVCTAMNACWILQMTHNIKSEVNSQNRVLDNLVSATSSCACRRCRDHKCQMILMKSTFR
jgi:hypothetical protein